MRDAHAVPEAHERGNRERQVAGPEHVEMARTGGEGPAIPARLDAGADDRCSVARMPRMATELAPKPDPDVVDVGGQDGGCDPGGEGHARLRVSCGRASRCARADGRTGAQVSPSRNLLDSGIVAARGISSLTCSAAPGTLWSRHGVEGPTAPDPSGPVRTCPMGSLSPRCPRTLLQLLPRGTRLVACPPTIPSRVAHRPDRDIVPVGD